MVSALHGAVKEAVIGFLACACKYDHTPVAAASAAAEPAYIGFR